MRWIVIKSHLNEQVVGLSSRAVGHVIWEGTDCESADRAGLLYDRYPSNRSGLGVVIHNIRSWSTDVPVAILVAD